MSYEKMTKDNMLFVIGEAMAACGNSNYAILYDQLSRVRESVAALSDERDALSVRVKSLEGFAIHSASTSKYTERDDWKAIARDPSRRVAAIKAYRTAHGSTLRDAKDRVFEYIESLRIEARKPEGGAA